MIAHASRVTRKLVVVVLSLFSVTVIFAAAAPSSAGAQPANCLSLPGRIETHNTAAAVHNANPPNPYDAAAVAAYNAEAARGNAEASELNAERLGCIARGYHEPGIGTKPMPRQQAPARPRPTVDSGTWDHVFNGGINRSGRVVGYHYRPGGQDRYGVRVTKISPVDRNGVYQGTVNMKQWTGHGWVEKSGISSFFPNNWSRDQIERAIISASSGAKIRPDGSWTGSYRGMRIQGYINRTTGYVETAFPLWNGPGK